MVTTLARSNVRNGSRLTEAEFAAWCDEDIKAEWVEGEVIIMSPSSVKHVLIARFLLELFDHFARRKKLGEAFGPELQVRLGKQKRRRVPDILFIATERLDILRDNHVEGAPDLVAEIVSPESVARDWREKYLEYEAAGVREYWVVDPLAERVEAYTLDVTGRYIKIKPRQKTIHSIVLPGFFLKPAWLWQSPMPDVLDLLKELRVL